MISPAMAPPIQPIASPSPAINNRPSNEERPDEVLELKKARNTQLLEGQKLVISTLHGLLQRRHLGRLARIGGIGIRGLGLRVRNRQRGCRGLRAGQRSAPLEHGFRSVPDVLNVSPGRGQHLLIALARLDHPIARGLVHRQRLPARLFMGLLGTAAFRLGLGVDLRLDLEILGPGGLILALESLQDLIAGSLVLGFQRRFFGLVARRKLARGCPVFLVLPLPPTMKDQLGLGLSLGTGGDQCFQVGECGDLFLNQR